MHAVLWVLSTSLLLKCLLALNLDGASESREMDEEVQKQKPTMVDLFQPLKLTDQHLAVSGVLKWTMVLAPRFLVVVLQP